MEYIMGRKGSEKLRRTYKRKYRAVTKRLKNKGLIKKSRSRKIRYGGKMYDKYSNLYPKRPPRLVSHKSKNPIRDINPKKEPIIAPQSEAALVVTPAVAPTPIVAPLTQEQKEEVDAIFAKALILAINNVLASKVETDITKLSELTYNALEYIISRFNTILDSIEAYVKNELTDKRSLLFDRDNNNKILFVNGESIEKYIGHLFIKLYLSETQILEKIQKICLDMAIYSAFTLNKDRVCKTDVKKEKVKDFIIKMANTQYLNNKTHNKELLLNLLEGRGTLLFEFLTKFCKIEPNNIIDTDTWPNEYKPELGDNIFDNCKT